MSKTCFYLCDIMLTLEVCMNMMILWVDVVLPYKVRVMKDKSLQEPQKIEDDQSKGEEHRKGCGSQ